MKLEFKLEERLVGFAAHTAGPGEKLEVTSASLVSPDDAAGVVRTLEELQRALFSRIPGFPEAFGIRQLLVLIRHDLSGVAYVNEGKVLARVRTTRDVVAGDPVRRSDIASIEGATLDIEVPEDCAVVLVQALGWKRAVYFDFGPLSPERRRRVAAFDGVVATQLLSLLGLAEGPTVSRSRADEMAAGLQQLSALLTDRCEEETRYQEVLEANPWMLPGGYRAVRRHENLDDRNIPDFTAERTTDGTLDIVELKQPFLRCFREAGDLASDLNDAWNQAERYLAFARDNRDYLLREKGLRFEHPLCFLIVGHEWTAERRRVLNPKISGNLAIRLLTYDQLVNQAQHVLGLVRTAQVGAES